MGRARRCEFAVAQRPLTPCSCLAARSPHRNPGHQRARAAGARRAPRRGAAAAGARLLPRAQHLGAPGRKVVLLGVAGGFEEALHAPAVRRLPLRPIAPALVRGQAPLSWSGRGRHRTSTGRERAPSTTPPGARATCSACMAADAALAHTHPRPMRGSWGRSRAPGAHFTLRACPRAGCRWARPAAASRAASPSAPPSSPSGPR